MSKLLKFEAFIACLLMSLGVMGIQNASADVASLEPNFVAGQSDVVSKLNNDRTTLTNSVNNIRGVYAGSPQTSGQVQADTVGEENMADDANPRIRTYEAAGCEFVYEGFLPGTTSGTLVVSIPAGTAYPRGYRIKKTSTTAHTCAASKWTYLDIDQNGTFQYQEVAINAAVPAVAANSIRIARISTDATQVAHVQDLRTLNCAAASFDEIKVSPTSASLGDLIEKGVQTRRFSPAGRTPKGYVQGLFVSWDTHTTFKVTSGGAFINGRYRDASEDVTVPQTNDTPSQGISGLDSGAIGASTKYYVYADADEDDVDDISITYSTSNSGPTGVTNARLIGSIRTDASSLFTSRDVVTSHAISEREIVGGWVTIDESASILDAWNVSGATDLGAGTWQIIWDQDFASAEYTVAGACRMATDAGEFVLNPNPGDKQVGSVTVSCRSTASGGSTDSTRIYVQAIGDMRL